MYDVMIILGYSKSDQIMRLVMPIYKLYSSYYFRIKSNFLKKINSESEIF